MDKLDKSILILSTILVMLLSCLVSYNVGYGDGENNFDKEVSDTFFSMKEQDGNVLLHSESRDVYLLIDMKLVDKFVPQEKAE